ncbi:MAG: extracellular solute-binding protein, partial [Halanaerobiales bacterium]
MGKYSLKRIIYFFILFMFVICTSNNIAYADLNDLSSLNYEDAISYDAYLEKYNHAAHPEREIEISAVDFSSTDMKLEIINNFQGYQGEVIKTEEYGYVEWEINVEEAGLYNIALEYYPIEGRGSDISRGLWINDELPFMGVKYIDLYRIWKSAGDIRVDNQGNQIAPPQEEAPRWVDIDIADSLGYYNEPYQFYFKEGRNTIRLISNKEPVVLGSIKVYQKEDLPSYEELYSKYQERGYQVVDNYMLKVQAENLLAKSTSSIVPDDDLSDPTVEPYHHAEIRLNMIGGTRWQMPGEWAEWEIEVPEDGLYMLGFKAKQNLLRGSYVTRKLFIDGEVPFEEASKLTFRFSNRYQMKLPGVDGEDGNPYLFYLSKGKHTIRMEVTLGDMAPIIRKAEDSLYELNNIYRKIMMITSASPDEFRDYQLEKRIPEVIEELGVQGKVLEGLADDLLSYTGEVGGQVASIREISRQFSDMSAKPKTIKRRMQPFRDNLANLGAWIIEAKNQPLTMDYLLVASPDVKLPRVQPTFMESALHETKKYIASYFVNYDMVGDVYDMRENDQEPLNVWIVAGRDQAQVLKRMIEDTFTPETGIFVNLELVNLGVLLPATLADRGPDVALGIEASGPMDFALRNSAVDLSQFEDFPEVRARYHESALVPYTFRDRVYALPQQQVFPMLFYRKDILYDMGLGIPETWDDVFKIIPELQKSNMNFGLPINDIALRRNVSGVIGMAAGAGSLSSFPGINPFLTFIYQQGEDLYMPDGVRTNLDSEKSIEAFRQWTDLYELYKIPTQYNPPNRFRTGEVPLLYENYPFYNFLQVFAPELRGKWGFTLMPGTIRED